MESLKGVYPAVVTPYAKTGELDKETLEKLIEFQLEAGVDGFYVCGTSGEGILLDKRMRHSVVKTVIDCVRRRAKVIVQVAACATDDAISFARDAAELGADAISSVPPIFFRVGLEGVRRYYTAIAKATDLPLIVYHIPALSGVALSLEEAGELFDVPNVCGIKFSDYNLFLLRNIREHYPNATVFSGNDEIFLAALSMGAHGSIGLTLNFMPEVYVGIFQAFEKGDIAEAQRLQFYATRVVEAIVRHNSIGACKAVLKMIGMDCGSTRGPVVPVEGKAYETLREELASIGFFDKRARV